MASSPHAFLVQFYVSKPKYVTHVGEIHYLFNKFYISDSKSKRHALKPSLTQSEMRLSSSVPHLAHFSTN